MSSRMILAALGYALITCSIGGCGRDGAEPPKVEPTTSTVDEAPAAPKRGEWVEVRPFPEPPRAEDFASGVLTMKKVDVARLTAFRQDLMERRAHDLSQHANKRTEMTGYFDDWLEKVDRELKARGCKLEANGRVFEWEE